MDAEFAGGGLRSLIRPPSLLPMRACVGMRLVEDGKCVRDDADSGATALGARDRSEAASASADAVINMGVSIGVVRLFLLLALFLIFFFFFAFFLRRDLNP